MSPSDILAIVVIVPPSLRLLPVVFRSQRGNLNDPLGLTCVRSGHSKKDKKKVTDFYFSRSNPLLYPDTP